MFDSVNTKSRDDLNEISGKIIDCAIRVHKELGPGMLEGAYEICLMHELTALGLTVASQVQLPINYRGLKLDAVIVSICLLKRR